MAAYLVLTLAVSFCFHRFHPAGPLGYALAILPALAIVAQIVAVGLYIAGETDEFQRNLFVQSILWGLGGLLTLTSVWGMLESFTRIPHFQPIWTFPVFWCFVGVSSPILMRRYR